MKKFSKLLFPLLLCSLHTPCVLAQSGDEEELALAYGDQSTISIATGIPQNLRRAPAVATVITAEEIAAMGASDIDEVLETVPGLHISRASARYSTVFLMRGIGGGGQTTPQVLILQNGIPLTTMYANDKGADWAGVPVANVARIEIIRGPGSALYGADAYAGVINVITKTAAETPGTEFGVRAGSFKTRNAWVQHGGKLGEADVAAYLNVGSTDGFKQTISADAQTRNDTLFGTKASLAPGTTNTGYNAIDTSLIASLDKWKLNIGYRERDKLQTGAGIASALDPGSVSNVKHFVGDLSWNAPLISQNWGVGFDVSYSSYAFTYPNNLYALPPGAQLPSGSFPNGMIGGPNQWERQLRTSASANYSGFSNHNLRFGVGYDFLNLYKSKTISNFQLNASGAPVPTGSVADNSDTYPYIRPQLRRIKYLFVQDEWSFARDWALTAGLRHDQYSDFGGTTNPRLALVWDASIDLTAKLLYGKAFRAPSFNEQYGINNPVANGNPNLKPESIQTQEAALGWKTSPNTQVNLSLFHYQMNDIIRLVANTPPPGFTYQNVGKQHGNGVELEAIWDAGRALRLTGNYSYQVSIDESSGKDAGYAPHHHLYARADWRYSGIWLFSGQVNRVADRHRAANDNRAPIPDYTTFDLTLRTTRGKDLWDFVASVRNLFNATVLEPSAAPGLQIPNDLPLASRTTWIQAIYKM